MIGLRARKAISVSKRPDRPRVRLGVIIASSRPARAGLPVARWLIEHERLAERFDVIVLDLATANLPLFDEPHSPRQRRYTQNHTKRWSAIIDPLDAFVFVTPEYNHGYPASLKNAIDYLHDEWSAKPIGFVAYGGSSGGAFCVAQLRQVCTALNMKTSDTAVQLAGFRDRIDAAGRLHVDVEHDRACASMLDELLVNFRLA